MAATAIAMNDRLRLMRRKRVPSYDTPSRESRLLFARNIHNHNLAVMNVWILLEQSRSPGVSLEPYLTAQPLPKAVLGVGGPASLASHSPCASPAIESSNPGT